MASDSPVRTTNRQKDKQRNKNVHIIEHYLLCTTSQIKTRQIVNLSPDTIHRWRFDSLAGRHRTLFSRAKKEIKFCKRTGQKGTKKKKKAGVFIPFRTNALTGKNQFPSELPFNLADSCCLFFVFLNSCTNLLHLTAVMMLKKQNTKAARVLTSSYQCDQCYSKVLKQRHSIISQQQQQQKKSPKERMFRTEDICVPGGWFWARLVRPEFEQCGKWFLFSGLWQKLKPDFK